MEIKEEFVENVFAKSADERRKKTFLWNEKHPNGVYNGADVKAGTCWIFSGPKRALVGRSKREFY